MSQAGQLEDAVTADLGRAGLHVVGEATAGEGAVQPRKFGISERYKRKRPSVIVRNERAVQRIVADLHESGYIEVFKEGRRNRYEVRFEKNLRHPVERHCTVQDLVQLVVP